MVVQVNMDRYSTVVIIPPLQLMVHRTLILSLLPPKLILILPYPPQGPAAIAKHLAAASAARALARQQQQARSGSAEGQKASVSVFGSFLKFANFDEFFSSLQDDDNNDHHPNHHDGEGGGERSVPLAVSNRDGVYLLSGCELPEQDLLEDTDFDLRYVVIPPTFKRHRVIECVHV